MPISRKDIDPQAAIGTPDDQMIAKVGKALRQVAEIREVYSQRLAQVSSEDERMDLAEQAEDAALEAIDSQGLSIERYDEVLTAAEADPELEQRLLAAARLA